MISDLAISEIEKMQKDGLSPTPADIIRLNALGLKIERCQDCGEFYTMPRVAFLGRLTFREPSLAAIEWTDRVMTYIAKDLQSQLCVNAFAISRHPDELPDATDRDASSKAIDKFTKEDLRLFTFPQIAAAVAYAIHGCDAVATEYPPPDDRTKAILDDPLASIGSGILMNTLALGLGISVREISSMTIGRVKMLQEVALSKANPRWRDHEAEERSAEFYSAVAEITDRLKGESGHSEVSEGGGLKNGNQ